MYSLKGGNCSICNLYFSNSLRLSNHEIYCYKKYTKRHTCIICKRKRYERSMKNVFKSSWACMDEFHFQVCCDNKEILIAKNIINELDKLKIINFQHLTQVNVIPERTISRDNFND